MRAEYDSHADALQIDLEDVERVDYDDDVGETSSVAIVAGRIVGIELLSPARHLDELSLVAERHGLDRQALESAAHAALAAPDRRITIDVAARAAAA